MIIFGIVCIMCGIATLISGFINAKIGRILLGLFCIGIWTYLLIRDVNRQNEQKNIRTTKEPTKMIVTNEYYIIGNDTAFVKADTTYKQL